MSTILIRNIQQLLQTEQATSPRSFIRGEAMGVLSSIDNAWLLIEGEKIADFGPMATCPDRAEEVIDATGRLVLPSFCDSHTHLVFAGSREGEFVDRIKGLSYEEIARRGGGILNSARRLQDTSEEALYEQAHTRLLEVQSQGTGAIEIKSGYGLNTEAELKMLRVVRKLKENSDLAIKATYLGAHALPLAYKGNKDAYMKLVLEETLPQVAGEGLADYIDIFCEKGFFSVADTEALLEAGQKYGLKGKIHSNQFNCMGGIQAAVKYGALSVDHLEVIDEEEIDCLKKSATIPTLLPSAPFFINDVYQPARRMIDAGLGVALASDYNPGSTPSGKMPFVLTLACVKLRMTPEEAINAATYNGACAMELENSLGSIKKGKIANIFISQPMSSYAFIPYAFGTNHVWKVLLKGKVSQ